VCNCRRFSHAKTAESCTRIGLWWWRGVRWLGGNHQAATVNRFAIIFTEPTPHAVGLANGQRVLGTFDPDGAATADFLGRSLPGVAGRAALAFGVEEDIWICTTAGPVELPIPNIRVGSGEPGDICHDFPSVEVPTIQSAPKVGQVLWREQRVKKVSVPGPSEVAPSGKRTHNGRVSPQTQSAPVDEHPELGLTVASMARRLGVAPATLRTWDRRYGLGPSTHRTGAHRRYTPTDVARLEHMRRLVMSGVPLADAAKAALSGDVAELATVTELETDASAAKVEGRAGGGHVVSIPGGSPAARGLARAAMALDGPACSDIIDETIDRRGVIWTWDHILVPVLAGVGQRWAQSGKAIDVEHVLSDSVSGCLSARARAVRNGVNAAPVLLAAGKDEMHSLPLWAVAAGLAEHNVSTRMLGDRVAPDVLAHSVHRIGPAVVLVWSQMSGRTDAKELLPLRAFRPAPLVLVGGPGWSEPLPEGIGRATDLTSAIRRITQVVSG